MVENEVTSYSEVREIRTFHIKSKTKADAERVLKLAIGSQDEVLSMTGRKWGYEAQVSHLVARDWPTIGGDDG